MLTTPEMESYFKDLISPEMESHVNEKNLEEILLQPPKNETPSCKRRLRLQVPKKKEHASLHVGFIESEKKVWE